MFSLVWIGVIVGLFARTAFLYLNQPDKSLQGEILLGHGLVMLILAAPLSWLVVFVVGGVAAWFGIYVEGLLDAALTSIACGAAGYLQWFAFVPWLWRKWKMWSSRWMIPHEQDRDSIG